MKQKICDLKPGMRVKIPVNSETGNLIYGKNDKIDTLRSAEGTYIGDNSFGWLPNENPVYLRHPINNSVNSFDPSLKDKYKGGTYWCCTPTKDIEVEVITKPIEELKPGTKILIPLSIHGDTMVQKSDALHPDHQNVEATVIGKNIIGWKEAQIFHTNAFYQVEDSTIPDNLREEYKNGFAYKIRYDVPVAVISEPEVSPKIDKEEQKPKITKKVCDLPIGTKISIATRKNGEVIFATGDALSGKEIEATVIGKNRLGWADRNNPGSWRGPSFDSSPYKDLPKHKKIEMKDWFGISTSDNDWQSPLVTVLEEPGPEWIEPYSKSEEIKVDNRQDKTKKLLSELPIGTKIKIPLIKNGTSTVYSTADYNHELGSDIEATVIGKNRIGWATSTKHLGWAVAGNNEAQSEFPSHMKEACKSWYAYNIAGGELSPEVEVIAEPGPEWTAPINTSINKKTLSELKVGTKVKLPITTSGRPFERKGSSLTDKFIEGVVAKRNYLYFKDRLHPDMWKSHTDEFPVEYKDGWFWQVPGGASIDVEVISEPEEKKDDNSISSPKVGEKVSTIPETRTTKAIQDCQIGDEIDIGITGGYIIDCATGNPLRTVRATVLGTSPYGNRIVAFKKAAAFNLPKGYSNSHLHSKEMIGYDITEYPYFTTIKMDMKVNYVSSGEPKTASPALTMNDCKVGDELDLYVITDANVVSFSKLASCSVRRGTVLGFEPNDGPIIIGFKQNPPENTIRNEGINGEKLYQLYNIDSKVYPNVGKYNSDCYIEAKYPAPINNESKQDLLNKQKEEILKKYCEETMDSLKQADKNVEAKKAPITIKDCAVGDEVDLCTHEGRVTISGGDGTCRATILKQISTDSTLVGFKSNVPKNAYAIPIDQHTDVSRDGFRCIAEYYPSCQTAAVYLKESLKPEKKMVLASQLKPGQKVRVRITKYKNVDDGRSLPDILTEETVIATVIGVYPDGSSEQFKRFATLAWDKHSAANGQWNLNSGFADFIKKTVPKELLDKFEDGRGWHIVKDVPLELVSEEAFVETKKDTISNAQSEDVKSITDNVKDNNKSEVLKMKQLKDYAIGDEVRVFLDDDWQVVDYDTEDAVRAKVLAKNPDLGKNEVILGFFDGDAPAKTVAAEKWKRLGKFGINPTGYSNIGGFNGGRLHYGIDEDYEPTMEEEEEIEEEEEEEYVPPVKTAKVVKKVEVAKMAPKVAKPTFMQMIQKDATEAAYRSAATQMTIGTKTAILALMAKQGRKNETIQAVSEALDSELGEAAVALLLGMGLTYAPMISEDPRAVKLATEFRTSGISTGMNMVLGAAMETVIPMISKTLNGLPSAEEPAKEITDKDNPVKEASAG